MSSPLEPLLEAFKQGHEHDMRILELLDQAADAIAQLSVRVAGLEERERARQDAQIIGDAA